MQPGTYSAVATKAVIWESEAGALMVTFEFNITSEGFENQTIKGQQCIVQKDGTISAITIRTLKECFGWAGLDPFELENPNNLKDKPVELVIEFEEYKGQQRLSVRYINAPGGGMPKPADRKAVLAKYGSKFRALSGGVPSAPTAPKPPASAPAPPAPPKPPAAKKAAAPPSTMDEAWAVCCHENEGKPEAEVFDLWNNATNKVKPGHQNDLSPEQWGQVKALLEDNVPY